MFELSKPKVNVYCLSSSLDAGAVRNEYLKDSQVDTDKRTVEPLSTR